MINPYWSRNSLVLAQIRDAVLGAMREAVMEAASKSCCGASDGAGAGGVPAPGSVQVGVGLLAAAAGLDHLLEDGLAVRDLVQTVIGERGVSVLVDVVGAKHRLPALGGVELVDDALAGDLAPVGVRVALDRVEDDRHGLVPVDRVRRRSLVARLLHVIVEELLAL